MTATTYPSSPVPSVRATATRRALKAEWTKLRTLPSTWRTVAMTVVAAIGFSALATAVQASSWATMSAQQRQAFDPTSTSLTGLWVAVVILGALGVRSVAAEYTTGMVRATFTAMPARRLVLAAKAATAAAFVFPLALVCDVVSFELGQRILAGKHIQVALGHPGTLQALIFGALARQPGHHRRCRPRRRHPAYGRGGHRLAMLILGGAILGQMLPAGLRQYIPGIAVQAAVTVHRSAGLLRPGTAVLVLCAYAAIALGAAALRVAHRDV